MKWENDWNFKALMVKQVYFCSQGLDILDHMHNTMFIAQIQVNHFNVLICVYVSLEPSSILIHLSSRTYFSIPLCLKYLACLNMYLPYSIQLFLMVQHSTFQTSLDKDVISEFLIQLIHGRHIFIPPNFDLNRNMKPFHFLKGFCHTTLQFLFFVARVPACSFFSDQTSLFSTQ